LNENPEPITGLRTGVPMELERVVNKCLEKPAAHRYQHADDLLADLRRLQLAPKSTVRTSPKVTAAGVSKKRLPIFVFPLALLVVAIILGVGYFFFLRETESKERIPIAVVDFVNETKEEELNGLSGMLITALEQSRRLSVLTRSRMFDILKQIGKEDVDRIDEALGREICRQANVDAMAIATIRKFGRLYTIDLKVFDPQKNEHLFTANEEGEGQESIPAMIGKLSEKTRRGLKEKAAEIQAASQRIAEVTTVNLEAYQHYFKGEELINKLKLKEAEEEFKKAISFKRTTLDSGVRYRY
jgi:TolB-like protein